MSPLSAMLSHSQDHDEVELLHTELSLRGFTVVHDACNFSPGNRVASEMETAVNDCDAFIPFFTPNSLYLDRPGTNRPALDAEFLPAMHRRRDSLLHIGRQGGVAQDARPLILPIAKRLGSRSAASEAVLSATGEDVGSFWSPSTVFDRDELLQDEAAAVSRDALRGLLRPGAASGSDPIELVFTSRGTGQPPRQMSLDATSILGGERRAGTPDDWIRLLAALQDVESVLAAHTTIRDMDVSLHTHLSAAFAFGRVFNQVGRWNLSIKGRQGATSLSGADRDYPLDSAWDPSSTGADVTVEIDLIGHPVFTLATVAIRENNLRLAGRLQMKPESDGEFGPAQVAGMVLRAATRIRAQVGTIRPAVLHVFMAVPVEFAALLGTRLTAMDVQMQLYEREGNSYTPVLALPANLR